MEIDIDWSILENIKDPKELEFCKSIKARIDKGETPNPSELIDSLQIIAGDHNKESFDKLKKMTNEIDKGLEILNKINK